MCSRKNSSDRGRRLRAFDRDPENGIQFIIVDLVGFIKVHLRGARRGCRPRRILGRSAKCAASRPCTPHCSAWRRMPLISGRAPASKCVIGRMPRISSMVRMIGGLVVHGAVDRFRGACTAKSPASATVRIHVIRPVLRVVFDDENRRRGPEPALRNAFDHHAERIIVIGEGATAAPALPGVVPLV